MDLIEVMFEKVRENYFSLVSQTSAIMLEDYAFMGVRLNYHNPKVSLGEDVLGS